jgi:hypothetical protein
MREHVQQHLAVGVGVDVAQVRLEHLRAQLDRVGQVAVVREADAVGTVHVERLRQCRARAARGGIAHVADAVHSAQALHVLAAEHVAHQAVGLALLEHAVVAGHDARGVLAAVLQHRQRIVELLVYVTTSDDARDAAHYPRSSVLRCPHRQAWRSACR